MADQPSAIHERRKSTDDALAEADQDDSAIEGQVTGKKSTPRKKKEATMAEETPKKQGRGRPPKPNSEKLKELRAEKKELKSERTPLNQELTQLKKDQKAELKDMDARIKEAQKQRNQREKEMNQEIKPKQKELEKLDNKITKIDEKIQDLQG